MGCRGSTPTLMTSGPVLPPASGVDRGGICPFPYHQKVDVGRGAFSRLLNCALVNWVSSAGLPRRGTRPAFPSAAAGKRIGSLASWWWQGKGEGTFPLPPTPHCGWERCDQVMPPSITQGWLTRIVDNRVNTTQLSRWGTGPILQSTVAGERLSQVPHLLKVSRGTGMRASSSHLCYHMAKERREKCSLNLTPPWLAPLSPCEQVQHLYLLPRWGVWPSLLSSSVAELQDQFFLVLQQERGRTNSAQLYILCPWFLNGSVITKPIPRNLITPNLVFTFQYF